MESRIKSVRKYGRNKKRRVVIQFVSGNVFSAVCYLNYGGYHLFGDVVEMPEKWNIDYKEFCQEIGTGKYDDFLNGMPE